MNLKIVVPLSGILPGNDKRDIADYRPDYLADCQNSGRILKILTEKAIAEVLKMNIQANKMEEMLQFFKLSYMLIACNYCLCSHY
ncbi:MAG: hypothetical protein AAFQ94_01560 [Bacteroidota bacterium]